MTTLIRFISILLVAVALGACAQSAYVTPGGGLGAELLEITDEDLQSYYETRPTAPFPASIAVVRVQDSGYRSYSRTATGTAGIPSLRRGISKRKSPTRS